MKTIGLLGGMSWESTIEYYRIINEGVKESLGGLHSAEVVLCSVDFEPIEKLQRAGDWEAAADILKVSAKKIQLAGADFVLICTNTMHKVFSQIKQVLDIPILHIADTTAEVLKANNIQTVGLIGTAFTMEQEFYKERLRRRYGIEVKIPIPKDRDIIHSIIYDELCLGNIQRDSKTEYLRIIDALTETGVEAVILGCTEIGMLIAQSDTKVRLLDTTLIHAQKAVQYAIE